MPSSSMAKWLAGVSADDDVNMCQRAPVDFGDVAKVRHVWPVFGKHFAAVRVDFGVVCDGKAGPFESEVHAADAAEETEHAHISLLCL